jgi:hypothetical protein
MAVPKKRKKLDEEEEILVSAEASAEEKKVTSETKENKTQRKSSYKPSKGKSEKVTEAFHVVDQIDSQTVSALEVHKFQPVSDQGIHIQFKLDLIRLEDILEIGNPKYSEKKENSIVIDFTIPYFWNLPILNEVTKTIVKELKKMKIIQ